jgi:hypothetical protein
LYVIKISDLVNEMMSKRFFKKKYKEIYINSIEIDLD